MDKKVRFGIIGLGNMGGTHVKLFHDGLIPRGEITAVCDIDPERFEACRKNYVADVKEFNNATDLFNSDLVDCVIIATPHYFHPTLAIEAMKKGINVISEKPAGVYAKAVSEMNKVAKETGVVFGVMFNQRTNPKYQKIREMVQGGEIGELQRVNWIITNWYRTQAYYDSGAWRASWATEGGGVILNQLPHQTDLLQWICGMPSKVTSFLGYGKYHHIEVEDSMTSYLEFPNGATGVFISTTGEFPGTNRLEIVGTKGKIVYEEANSINQGEKDAAIKFFKNDTDSKEYSNTAETGFSSPDCHFTYVETSGENPQHAGITNNICDAILDGKPLLAPGVEGINGVRLANAFHLSDWLGKTVELPVDEDLFYEKLQEKINNSTFVKNEVKKVVQDDMSGTY